MYANNNELAAALAIELKIIPSNGPESIVPSLAARFRDAGFSSVRIEFDGSGDSGAIESIFVVKDGNHDFLKEDSELYKVLSEWGYSAIDRHHVDWYNNDGGFGHIEFNLDDSKYDLEIYQRETTSSLGASEELEI
jgi:hypothetical protein